VIVSAFWETKRTAGRLASTTKNDQQVNRQMSKPITTDQLSPYGHLAITDTLSLRTVAEVPGNKNYSKQLPLLRLSTLGPDKES